MEKGKLQAVYLLRHGETAWTLTSQHTSYTDLDLTPNGRRESKRLGESLKGIKFDHIFCSPLKRAKETCAIAGFRDRAIIDKDLVEWNYGKYEGLTSEEIQKTDSNWTIFSKDPPGGERARDVQERADRFLARILPLEGTVAVFSSGHFSRVLGVRWISLPIAYGERLLLSTASKSHLGFKHGYQVIHSWNDTAHLK